MSIAYLNSLFYSEPGVGKTHLIGTAQDHKLTAPVFILDVDGGISTLRKRTEIDVVQVRSTKQLVDAYKTLFNAIPSDGKRYPYGTVAIDTLSELQSLDLSEIMKQFARINDKIDPDVPDVRGYGKSGSHMRQIVRMFRDLPCNTIFTCHAQTDRNNDMKLMTQIKLVGKLRTEAAGFLDIVGYYRAEADGDTLNRYMQFRGTDTTVAKDRTGAFEPVEVNPTIPMLWDKLQASNTAQTNGKGETK